MIENRIIQLFTIGYQSENEITNINEFFECLEFYRVFSLIDIRDDPMPTDYPEYDRGHLHQLCENKSINYHWAGRQLGNRRIANEFSRHDGLTNKSLRAYADYMDSKDFQIAASQIINMTQQGTTLIFTKLKQPENCFRGLLSDYLLLQGIQVTHIVSTDECRDHLLHKNARRESVELIYDNMSKV